MISHYLLSLLIWFPIAGGFLTLATGNDQHLEANRWVALLFAIITMFLAVLLYADFNSSLWQMQFVENVPWIPAFNIHYSLGVDGISMLFILLTCFTNLIVILAAWRAVTKKSRNTWRCF